MFFSRNKKEDSFDDYDSNLQVLVAFIMMAFLALILIFFALHLI